MYYCAIHSTTVVDDFGNSLFQLKYQMPGRGCAIRIIHVQPEKRQRQEPKGDCGMLY